MISKFGRYVYAAGGLLEHVHIFRWHFNANTSQSANKCPELNRFCVVYVLSVNGAVKGNVGSNKVVFPGVNTTAKKQVEAWNTTLLVLCSFYYSYTRTHLEAHWLVGIVIVGWWGAMTALRRRVTFFAPTHASLQHTFDQMRGIFRQLALHMTP